MKKIGIYYGSSNGTTESVAERIAAKLGVDAANVHNAAAADPSEATGYDLLVIGSSTWGAGELQDGEKKGYLKAFTCIFVYSFL